MCDIFLSRRCTFLSEQWFTKKSLHFESFPSFWVAACFCLLHNITWCFFVFPWISNAFLPSYFTNIFAGHRMQKKVSLGRLYPIKQCFFFFFCTGGLHVPSPPSSVISLPPKRTLFSSLNNGSLARQRLAHKRFFFWEKETVGNSNFL